MYGEKLVTINNKEYRVWNALDSKLAAALKKGIKDLFVRPEMTCLYLGSSTGTTASHISDIVGKNGCVFCVESAPRVMREFLFLCEERENLVPILADASQPELYKERIIKVEWLYQDVAQRNQVDIFLRNTVMFARKGAYCVLTVKARNIDVKKEPKKVFEEVEHELEKHLKIIAKTTLEPFQKDHMVFVMRY